MNIDVIVDDGAAGGAPPTGAASAEDALRQQHRTPSTGELTNAMGIPAKKRERRPWTQEEDERLRLLVSYWGDQCGKNGHWDKISSHFVNRSNKDCRKRWFHSLDPKLKRGRWTDHEDRVLMEAYKKMGPVWHRIAQLIPGRTDDQCSKRYNDVLDPSISDRLRPWTPEEDKRLLDLVKEHGTKWRTISKDMEGRTGLTCRNRWRKLVSPAVKRDSVAGAGGGGEQQPAAGGPVQAVQQGQPGQPVSTASVAASGQLLGPQAHVQPPPPTAAAAAAVNNINVRASVPDARGFSSTVPRDGGGPGHQSLGIGATAADGHQSLVQESVPPAVSSAVPSYQPIPKDHVPPTLNGTPPVETRYTYSLGKSDDRSGSSVTEQAVLSRNDIQALVDLAAQRGQSIVIHQHNYHYHYHTGPLPSKAGAGSGPAGGPQAQTTGPTSSTATTTTTTVYPSSGTGVVATPSQDLLDLEQFEVDEEDLQGLDSSFGFGMEDYHGIPFNPS